MKRITAFAFASILTLLGSGCGAQKIVALPLRVTGAVISVVPVVGDAAHGVLDATADVID